jgi:hypothetical protein
VHAAPNPDVLRPPRHARGGAAFAATGAATRRIANRYSAVAAGNTRCRRTGDHSADSHASANSVRLPHESFGPPMTSAVTDALRLACGTSSGARRRRSSGADAEDATASSRIANGAVSS